MAKTEWLTTEQYAERMQRHPQHVRDLCASGRLNAQKVGGVWRIPYIDPPEFEAESIVKEAIGNIVEPCVAVVDAAINELEKMKANLQRAEKEFKC